jgi:hypothetical protein
VSPVITTARRSCERCSARRRGAGDRRTVQIQSNARGFDVFGFDPARNTYVRAPASAYLTGFSMVDGREPCLENPFRDGIPLIYMSTLDRPERRPIITIAIAAAVVICGCVFFIMRVRSGD